MLLCSCTLVKTIKLRTHRMSLSINTDSWHAVRLTDRLGPQLAVEWHFLLQLIKNSRFLTLSTCRVGGWDYFYYTFKFILMGFCIVSQWLPSVISFNFEQLVVWILWHLRAHLIRHMIFSISAIIMLHFEYWNSGFYTKNLTPNLFLCHSKIYQLNAWDKNH